MHDGDGDGESGGGPHDEGTHVVTAFLRNRGEILLLRRSDAVGTYAGRWGGVSGYAEGNPDEQVRVEIREETGLAVESGGADESEGEGEDARADAVDPSVSLVRSARPVRVEDPDLERTWLVHPSLFDCETREVTLSEEHTASEWVSPTAMLGVGPGSALDSGTVPGLWAAYERVAPTVRSVAADDEHGAATLSVRALEVLRDRAGVLVDERESTDGEQTDETADLDAEWDELAALARQLLEARPSMAVLRNRVNRAMAGADGRDAEAVLASAIEGIDRALEADTAAAANAGEHATGTVLTLSRSGTVLETFRVSDSLDRVFVAESRPACEGRDVAERLATDGDLPVALHTDAAAAHVLAREDVDCVLVGADTVLPDGRVINKTGTRSVAIAAAHEGVPVYVVAAGDKVSPHGNVTLESGTASAVYDGDAPVDVANPTFDVTPAECVDGVVTEDGLCSTDEIGGVVEALRALEDWRSE